MKKYLTLTVSLLTLNACVTDGMDFPQWSEPEHWTRTSGEENAIENVAPHQLKSWWKRFDDPVLNRLVDLLREQNPDKEIAQARIQEARGLRRTTRSSLFPQIGLSGNTGREDTGSATDNFYDAGFDMSFELDVFGVNRNNIDAADADIKALESEYHDVTLTLIAELVRTYVEMKEGEKQVLIAQENLDIQEKTLTLVKQQRDVGEAPQLDVERSETLVNTTRSSISRYQRLKDNAQLRLTTLTGEMPESVGIVMADSDIILSSDHVLPALIAPATVLRNRPDIRAASYNLVAKTSLRESAIASLFPTFSLSGFYGVVDNSLVNSTNIWSMALGTAVSLIDFGRIEGQIDAARAREKQAFEQYRKIVLNAVVEVETALSDYMLLHEEQNALMKAYENANNALVLSQQLYKEGEISFIDVLDVQRTVNDSQSSLVTAEAQQIQSVIRLYKSLGVYE